MKRFVAVLMASVMWCCGSALAANSYYSHVVFDNSLTPDQYFYSRAHASNTSTLAAGKLGRLPVETDIFFSPPNALRLEWQSRHNGGWSAEIQVPDIRNLPPDFTGDTLFFWCYAKTAIPKSALPLIQLADARGGFSAPLNLADFMTGVPTAKWTQVRIPLQRFTRASFRTFEPAHLRSIVFVQSVEDDAPHSLILDDIKIDFPSPAKSIVLAAPTNVQAKGYARHVDITWESRNVDWLQHYVIYRSLDGNDFQPIGIQIPAIHRYSDYIGRSGQKAFIKSRKLVATIASRHCRARLQPPLENSAMTSC